MALEMKFGGDPKRNAFLGILLLVLAYLLYTNVFSGPSYETTPSAAPATAPAKTPAASRPAAAKANAAPVVVSAPPKKTLTDRRSIEFRPRVGAARAEERPDPMSVDPTLRLELLARLEKVQFAGGLRSLFDFSNVSTGPAVPKIIPAKKAPPPPAFIGPMAPPPPPPPYVAPPPPAAPPIPLKFYGFTSAPKNVGRKAFFLDGDDIVVAAEGDLIKRRYKVIRIGLTNVTMEDTQFKQQQTLPIVPDNQGGA